MTYKIYIYTRPYHFKVYFYYQFYILNSKMNMNSYKIKTVFSQDLFLKIINCTNI